MADIQTSDLMTEAAGNRPSNAEKLKSFATAVFPDLYEGEQTLIQAVAGGQVAEFRPIKIEPDKPEDPSDGHKWGLDRTLRAKLIKWLCTERIAENLIASNVIHIKGAKIDDELNFDYMTVNMPILLHGCYVIKGISFRYAKVRTLEFTGTRVASINAEGANIDGRLCLDEIRSSYAGASKDKDASACLSDAKISGSLICNGSHFRKSGDPALLAIALDVRGGVTFDSAVVQGTVDLSGATIGGDLTCKGTHFLDPNPPENPSTNALAVSSTQKPWETDDDVTTKTPKYWIHTSEKRARRSPKLRGLVLNGVEIGGNLDCSGCVFGEGKQAALQASEVVVARHVLLENITANGKVHIDGATIGGNLDCDGGKFLNKEKEDSPEAALPEALSAQRVQVKASIRLRNCTAEGTVNLYGAIVGGNVHCKGSKFTGPPLDKSNTHGTALKAIAAKVTGDLNLDTSFVAKGKVVLDGATIGGNLNCDSAEFTSEDKETLLVRRVEVKSRVGLIGSRAKGRIDFSGATVGGNLECSGGKFDNPGNAGAFLAAGAQITGDLILNYKANDNKQLTEVKGTVNLQGAIVGGNLKLDKSHLENHDGEVLNAEGAEVKGSVSFDECTADGRLNLSHLRIGGALRISGMVNPAKIRSLDIRFTVVTTLEHAEDSWPRPDYLYLNGLTYSAVGAPFQTSKKACVRWLQLQVASDFSSQPYEQLAKVLRAMGDEAGERKVLIRKWWEIRRRGKLGPAAWLWNWFLCLTVGYGYWGWLPLVWAAVLVAVGALLFQGATFQPAKSNSPLELRALAETQERPLPEDGKSQQLKPVPISDQSPRAEMPSQRGGRLKYPILYSMDVFLPFADLGQKKSWVLDESQPHFLGYEVYYLIEFLGGWVLTAVIAAVATGLIKKG